MKLCEWGVYLAVILLLYAGLFLWSSGDLFLAVTCSASAVGIAAAYVYIVKIRPIGKAKNAFRETISQNGFVPVNDKQYRKQVVQLLRQFPGFDDFSLEIEHLCAAENDSCMQFVGKYVLAGQGLNFGYFLLAVFPPSNTPAVSQLDKGLDCKRPFTPEDEFSLARLPQNACDALRRFPYEFYLRGNLCLADFDTRHLRMENFSESLQSMINTLPSLTTA